MTRNKTAKVEMLPDNYDYKFLEIFEHDHTGSYTDLSYNQRKVRGNGSLITMKKQRRRWFMSEARNKMGRGWSKNSTCVVNITKDRQENTQKVQTL